jgi:hypothetical protein
MKPSHDLVDAVGQHPWSGRQQDDENAGLIHGDLG